MIATIKDYFLNVLVRAIINYVSFAFIMLVILVGYVLITDWATMVNFAIDLTNNDFAKVVVWLPLVSSLFKADTRPSNEAKKFYEKTKHFFEMYDTTGGNW